MKLVKSNDNAILTFPLFPENVTAGVPSPAADYNRGPHKPELRTDPVPGKYLSVAVAENTFPMLLPNGETVMAEERFYLVNVSDEELNFSDWTTQEKK